VTKYCVCGHYKSEHPRGFCVHQDEELWGPYDYRVLNDCDCGEYR
jgi:hypothetical protein